MDNLANQAEESANRGEQGKMYKIIKIACSRYGGATDVRPIGTTLYIRSRTGSSMGRAF